MACIAENIKIVREAIEKAAISSGRKPEDITLVAATKTMPPDKINEAVQAGVFNIGENRVQEFTDKYGKVGDNAIWHFIGHLQTNKVKYIVGKTALIHSADSTRLLDEIERQSKNSGAVSRVLVEVNVSGEETKFGVRPEEVFSLIEDNEKRGFVKIEGLMTIGPNTSSIDDARKAFRNLYKLFLDIRGKKYDNSNMKYLSMGMSADYAAAIEEGANIVRVGSAIFGARHA